MNNCKLQVLYLNDAYKEFKQTQSASFFLVKEEISGKMRVAPLRDFNEFFRDIPSDKVSPLSFYILNGMNSIKDIAYGWIC